MTSSTLQTPAPGAGARRRGVRWLAPLAVVAVVGGGTGLAAARADADPRLAPKTPEQLLVDLQKASVPGLSGTVTQSADLGLPALPSAGGSSGSADLTSLLSGDHTLRVWYAGPDKARLAMVDDLGETDVIANGTNVWTWNSKQNEATHVKVKPGSGADATPPSGAPSTPQEAAKQALAAIGPSTAVSTDSSVEVAGRSAYELVLTPKDSRSLVGRVAIAVDSKTSIPLRVEMVSSNDKPVFTVAYNSVDFSVPDAAQFRFNPPPGAKVTDKGTVTPDKPSAAERKAAQKRADQARSQTKVVGSGWTQVVVTKVPADQASGQLEAFVRQLPKVSGSWGSGRLLSGTAFTAVLTDDGRLAVGAVRPELVYDALAK